MRQTNKRRRESRLLCIVYPFWHFSTFVTVQPGTKICFLGAITTCFSLWKGKIFLILQKDSKEKKRKTIVKKETQACLFILFTGERSKTVIGTTNVLISRLHQVRTCSFIPAQWLLLYTGVCNNLHMKHEIAGSQQESYINNIWKCE